MPDQGCSTPPRKRRLHRPYRQGGRPKGRAFGAPRGLSSRLRRRKVRVLWSLGTWGYCDGFAPKIGAAYVVLLESFSSHFCGLKTVGEIRSRGDLNGANTVSDPVLATSEKWCVVRRCSFGSREAI